MKKLKLTPSLENFSEKEIKTTAANKLKGGGSTALILDLIVSG